MFMVNGFITAGVTVLLDDALQDELMSWSCTFFFSFLCVVVVVGPSLGIFTGVVRKNVYHYSSSTNNNGRRKSTVNLASHKDMVECVEEVDEAEPNVRELAKDDDETLILQKLADRHYG